MLNDFVNPNGALYNKLYKSLVPRIVDKINHFNNQGFPVVYIGDVHSSDDPEFDLFPEHCTTPWGQSFVPEIDNLIEISPKEEDQKSYVLSKDSFSPFIGNKYGEYNSEIFFDVLQPSEIHVTGILSNICVLYTVSDLVLEIYMFTKIVHHLIMKNCTDLP
jgi:nicotinamidase/pyrazinamidase